MIEVDGYILDTLTASLINKIEIKFDIARKLWLCELYVSEHYVAGRGETPNLALIDFDLRFYSNVPVYNALQVLLRG